jgi:hypothetical protein
VFKKHNLNPELEEKILDEFFRSAPLEIMDFGYWQDRFYIKDINLAEFLAAQIAYRVKTRFREDGKLFKKYLVGMVEGSYKKLPEAAFIYIDFNIRLNEILKVMGEKENRKLVFENILMETADCIYGYKFEDFDFIKIIDKDSLATLIISKDDLYAFKRGKLGIESILSGI